MVQIEFHAKHHASAASIFSERRRLQKVFFGRKTPRAAVNMPESEPVLELPSHMRNPVQQDHHVRAYYMYLYTLFQTNGQPAMDHIRKECFRRRIPLKILFSSSRRRTIVPFRQEMFYDLRENFGMTFPEIGKMFDKDHTTIIHGYYRHKARLEGNDENDP